MLISTSPAAIVQNQAWIKDLEAARAGDRPALERVLTRSRQDLRRYAEHHCVVNDVEDAVQESLFTASRRMMDLRQLECFASWLFRIVKRECNRMKRGLRTFMHEPITEDIAETCIHDPGNLSRDLAAAMESLPAHYREIVLLRDLEGLTIAELAERLGLTREATKARLHRARSLAREYLKD
jgi:RNA polymerase sigma factor (sigma-70 family)